MRKRSIIIFSILLSICAIAKAQIFSVEDEKLLLEKIANYQDGKATQHIKELLRLYSTGTVPDQKVINSNYAGIVYVLDDSENRYQLPPFQASIAPAMWLGTAHSARVQGIRRRGSTNVNGGYDNEYIKLYNQNQSLTGTGEGKYILSSIQQMTDDSSRDGLPYKVAEKECVIGNNIFARINGDDLIAISITGEMAIAMIHSFKISKQKELLTFSQSKPQATQNLLDKYREEEKERNSFSEMIETIVNHPEVTMYYHDKEMYILSDGLFRNDLEIKYQNKDMLILPFKLEGLKNYIVFTHMNYDGEEDHPVTFQFNIPEEGAYGVATFEPKNEKWLLEELSMLEN